jgi:hypothetical protein
MRSNRWTGGEKLANNDRNPHLENSACDGDDQSFRG